MHHLDVHISDIAVARRLFDALMPLVGYEPRSDDDFAFSYWSAGKRRPAIGFILDRERCGSGTMRVAFAVASDADVDRVAAAATECGARNIEGPAIHAEYGNDFYAVFFEDQDGNKFEVCRDNSA